MENDFDQKAVSSQAAPPPPAPSVQLAQAHGERSCNEPGSDDRGFAQETCGRAPEEGEAAGAADRRGEAFARRGTEKAVGDHRRSLILRPTRSHRCRWRILPRSHRCRRCLLHGSSNGC